MITKQLKTVNPCLMKTRYVTSAATIRSMVSGSIRLSLGLDQQWLLSPSVTESNPIPNSMAAVVHPRVRQIREETARMEVNKMNRLATKMSMKIRIKPRKMPAIKFSNAFFIVPWITWTRVVKSFICLSLLPVFDCWVSRPPVLLRSQLVDDGDAAGVLTDSEWCNNSDRCIGERLHFQREVEQRDRKQGDPKQRGCCCPAQGEAEKGRAAKDGSGGDHSSY